MKVFLCSGIACGLIAGAATVVPQTAQTETSKPTQGVTEPTAVAEQKNPVKQTSDVWMKAKQRNAHAIFDGLTEGDFEKIEASTLKMMGNNFLERWMVDRKEYEQYFAYHGQLNAFEYSTKELWRFAKQKDMDGALQAYVRMSQSCVRCHSLIREGAPAGDGSRSWADSPSQDAPGKKPVRKR